MLCIWGLDSSQAAPQVPWPNKAAGFDLQMVSAADQALTSSVAGLSSFLVAPARFPGWDRPGAILSSGQGYDLAPLPRQRGRPRSRDGKTFSEVPNQADVCPHQIA